MKRVGKATLTFSAVAVVWLVAAGGVATWWIQRGPSVAEHVDLSGPREAVASFAMCLTAGHRADVIGCVIQEAEQQQLATGFVDAVAAGLDADDLTQLPMLEVETATVESDGDTARVVTGDGDGRPSSFTVRRVGGVWRIDLLETMNLRPDEAQALATRLRSAAQALKILEEPE
jgi:hypothetical protein